MAPRIEFKRLPRGWRYVLTRRQVREVCREVGDELVCVRFDGTHSDHSKNPSLYGAGTVEARRRDDSWYFRLTLEGLRDSFLATLAPGSPEPAEAVLSFVSQCRAMSPDPRSASRELRLYYWHREEQLMLEPSESETNYLGRLFDRSDSWVPASPGAV